MVKNPPTNAGDAGSIPGSGRSPGEGNGNPLQYSCLENYMVREVWWAAVYEVLELDTTEHTLNSKAGFLETKSWHWSVLPEDGGKCCCVSR